MFHEEKLKEEREVKWRNCWKRHENATNPRSWFQIFRSEGSYGGCEDQFLDRQECWVVIAGWYHPVCWSVVSLFPIALGGWTFSPFFFTLGSPRGLGRQWLMRPPLSVTRFPIFFSRTGGGPIFGSSRVLGRRHWWYYPVCWWVVSWFPILL